MVIILMTITGCNKKDAFYFKDVAIQNNQLNFSSPWRLYSATYDSIQVFYDQYSPGSVKVSKTREHWLVPVEPKSMQILGFNEFANLNSPCRTTHLIRGKKFLLENKEKIQYILDTVRDCPAIKESGTKVPE